MARPKGSGVLKFIDPMQDTVAIREMLHVGRECPSTMSKAAIGLIRWRELSARRDDCAKRVKSGGDKRSRTLLKTLKLLVADKWRELGVELGRLGDEQFQAVLSQTLEHSRLSSRPPVFGWQAEATRLVEIAYLLGGDDDKPTSLNGATVDLTACKLEAAIRANGCRDSFTLHDLRRFIRDILQVKLRNERGQRNDLKRKRSSG